VDAATLRENQVTKLVQAPRRARVEIDQSVNWVEKADARNAPAGGVVDAGGRIVDLRIPIYQRGPVVGSFALAVLIPPAQIDGLLRAGLETDRAAGLPATEHLSQHAMVQQPRKLIYIGDREPVAAVERGRSPVASRIKHVLPSACPAGRREHLGLVVDR